MVSVGERLIRTFLPFRYAIHADPYHNRLKTMVQQGYLLGAPDSPRNLPIVSRNKADRSQLNLGHAATTGRFETP